MALPINKYKLPLNRKDISSWSKSDSPAHTGSLKHSIDFMCKVGTPIYASSNGTVVWLRNDSKVGGDDKKYWNLGNRIVLKHSNSEYTAYEHLRYKGAIVKVGQQVKLYELIGYSGNTGYSDRPHLHFEVFNKPEEDESEGKTLSISFSEL